jgi:hypothetical protein
LWTVKNLTIGNSFEVTFLIIAKTRLCQKENKHCGENPFIEGVGGVGGGEDIIIYEEKGAI